MPILERDFLLGDQRASMLVVVGNDISWVSCRRRYKRKPGNVRNMPFLSVFFSLELSEAFFGCPVWSMGLHNGWHTC